MGCCQSQKDTPLLQIEPDTEYSEPAKINPPTFSWVHDNHQDRAPSPYILDSDQIFV